MPWLTVPNRPRSRNARLYFGMSGLGADRWKWPGGKAGDVDAEGHSYGSAKGASAENPTAMPDTLLPPPQQVTVTEPPAYYPPPAQPYYAPPAWSPYPPAQYAPAPPAASVTVPDQVPVDVVPEEESALKKYGLWVAGGAVALLVISKVLKRY